MNAAYSETEKAVSEAEVKDKGSDFIAKYFAVYHLQCVAQRRPEIVGPETIFTLEGLLEDPEFSRQWIQ